MQSKRSKRLTLIAMTLGFVVVQLDVTVVNVAIKSIGSSIGGAVSSLQWIVNSYTLAFAALILTAGALGDRIGAKRVFIIGFVIFTAFSLACGLAPNLPFLVTARVMQGVGAAILVPCSLALLNHAYVQPVERTRAVGIWAAGASIALAAGPIVGGSLIALLGWRSIFFINLPLGLAGIWLTYKYVAETAPSGSRGIDIPGQLAIAAGLAILAASMIEGGKMGWTDVLVLSGFILFIICITAFIVIERKVKEPMLPLSLFKIRNFSVTSIIGFLINISFYGLIFIFSLYFQQLRHFDPLRTGLAFLPLMCALMPANLLAGKLAKNFGAAKVILLGQILFLAGCLALSGLRLQTPYLWIALPLAIMGFGLGAVVPPMTTAMLGSVDKRRSGLASGVLNSMRQSGSVVGVALFGSLIVNKGGFLSGFHLALIISSILLIFSIITACLIKKS